MTVVPLPDVATLRVRLIWNQGLTGEGANRLYFKYSGSAPSAANCATLASDIASAWNTNIGPLCADNIGLSEVDVLDIATDSGLSGQWTGSHVGSRSGSGVPSQCCMNVEFDIARRYRGGKPRCYLPAGVDGDFQTTATWTSALVSAVNTDFAAFITAVEALSVGSVGTLTHICLSYYKGFTNITNSSGRERAVPTYRDTALSDTVEGYAAKIVVGSQKRRRTSTTP